MKKNKQGKEKREGKRLEDLPLFILAGTRMLRYEVLDKSEIDKEEIVKIADNIEKHIMELAQLTITTGFNDWLDLARLVTEKKIYHDGN